MKQFIHGFVVDPNTAIKNENNEIIISYADLDLSGKPMVFLTPYLPSGYPKAIPTVVRVGNTHITIKDDNINPTPPAGYRLNIVLADPNPGSFNDAMLYPKLVPKTAKGRLMLDTDETRNVAFLSPFWDGGSSVGTIETINREEYDEGYGYLNTYTNSGNALPSGQYYVNYLSVRSESEMLIRGSNVGLSQEGGSSIPLPNTWDPNPCVILTPHMNGDAIAKSLPFVTHYENNSFKVNTQHPEYKLNLNYMAVPQDVPRMGTDHKLNEAFEHIFTHLPTHKAHIEPFRSEFENIILRGAEPSEALKNKVIDFTPSFPENKTRTEPSEIHIAMAKVCFDAVAILINAFTAVEVSVTGPAIKAISKELKIAEESTPLLQEAVEEVRDFAKLFKDLSKPLYEAELAVLKKIAKGLMGIAGSMITLGVVKWVLVAMYTELKKSWYKAIISGLTIVAQILALALSGPAAAIAWGFRIAGLLGSAATLGIDAYDLYCLENPGSCPEKS